ncbi:uncharacterized protein LOC116805349 [Drosophila grimshawi]|uniref:uncharacterized protein LOC116805349 n=1 Tax=Drosophila grimshawi TaxID=7222 RepID=UPI0013EF17E6|nr:uncharacterized protein LOC116805349 [Drosophila grimshawi]
MIGNWSLFACVLALLPVIIIGECEKKRVNGGQNGEPTTTAAGATNNKPDDNPTTSTTTTESIIKLLDNHLTEKLIRVINSKEGYFRGNEEYENHIDDVIRVSKLSEQFYSEKYFVYKTFVSYNQRRIELEEKISERIHELWNLLEKGSKCFDFYKKQLFALNKSLTKSNAQKANILMENKDTCSSEDNKNDQTDYSDNDNDYMFNNEYYDY